MLLKLPIILSSNSFYFNLLFPKLFPVQSILLNHKSIKKLQYILPIKEVHTKSVVSQLAKGIFSELRCYGRE